MARKSKNRNFDEMLEALRAHSFDVSPFPAIANGMMVSKGEVAAVVVPGVTNERWESGGARLAVTPGLQVRGEIARLLDRGYQKFIKTSKFELPATSVQLHAIQSFTEELNLVTGALGLYNESLGTTSDVYLYDRVRGRDDEQPKAPWPSELAEGH
ncbi:MAG TPA: hypothetical protein VFE01_00145 [Terracidiphilus sp.]|jgi:hypothetical protein|nr:hypothetical protein [Terracidiphilus sp.]